MDIEIENIRKQLPDFLINPNPQKYNSENYVLLDFETTNLDNGSPYNKDNYILFAAWYCGKDHPAYTGKVEYQWGNEYELQELVGACEYADFIIAHNAKFELGWLDRCGLNTDKVLPYCTQLGEYVLAGNRHWRFSLEASLKRYKLGGKETVVSKMMKAGWCPSEIPPHLLQRYGIKDVVQTHKLFRKQRKRLNNLRLLPVQLTRNIFTTPLVNIERNGMHLDADRVNAVYKDHMQRRNQLQIKLDKITGGVNFKSTKQMVELLFKTLKFKIPTDHKGDPLVNRPNEKWGWPDGVPKADKDTIAKLKAKNKKQQEFLDLLTEVKKLDSSITKFIGKMAACVEETDDHILHASMNQTRTRTHRLSSSGRQYKLQFQNFDRRFKPLFSPRNPGWLFAEADEAQLEYRTAVFLGDDETGRADIANGVDAHSLTASIIFKEQWEECGGDKKSTIGKFCRQESKPFTFKPLYGGKSGTDRQKEYFAFFMEKHKGIAAVQEEWKSKVYRKRKLRTASGLIFYWETSKLNRRGILMRPDGRPADQSICNYPVQSLATAEIVPIAVTYLYHLMKAAGMESFLVNTVHDSALGEIHPNETELFSKLAVQSMVEEVYTYLDKVYNIDFDVPLETEVELKSHWANYPDWENEYMKQAA
jgi:DNA polymerase I-like protein with 3'-5' exonuclease and polymerase domains